MSMFPIATPEGRDVSSHEDLGRHGRPDRSCWWRRRLALIVSRHRTDQSLAAERYVAALNDGYERVVADLAEAQMGMHGYLLTGQDRFLEPFELASGRIPRDMLTLEEATRGRPGRCG